MGGGKWRSTYARSVALTLLAQPAQRARLVRRTGSVMLAPPFTRQHAVNAFSPRCYCWLGEKGCPFPPASKTGRETFTSSGSSASGYCYQYPLASERVCGRFVIVAVSMKKLLLTPSDFELAPSRDDVISFAYIFVGKT